MSKFKVVADIEQVRLEHDDNRSFVEKMFFNHNAESGELDPLPIVPIASDADYKAYEDCIPLITKYREKDENYSGFMKGKNVVVLGGRRRGRAGTGVEVLLPVECLAEFAKTILEVEASLKDAAY